VLIDILVNKR